MKNPAHPYTRGLIRSYPAMNRAKDLQGIPGMMSHGLEGCPFHDRCTQRIEICKTLVPLLQEVKGRFVACHRGGIVPLLEVRDLGVSFDSYSALSGVDLTLYEGETLAVVGESGSERPPSPGPSWACASKALARSSWKGISLAKGMLLFTVGCR